MATAENGAAMPRRHNNRSCDGQLEMKFRMSRRLAWFDEERALAILPELGWRYREGIGFYHGVKMVQPQHLWTPGELKERGGRELANFFFFLAMSQRGGLNSDDSIRLTHALWVGHRELFEPSLAAEFSAGDIQRRIQAVAEKFYRNGLRGDREHRAGALSFKLHEFVSHWQKNAAVLAAHWGSSLLAVFAEQKTFEEYFVSIDRGSEETPRENSRGFYGMRRKIFSLLAFWLIEFKLVREFRIPLVVDFHVMRVLLQLGILQVRWRPLGPGDPKIPARQRPRALWKYPSVRITETLVNRVIAWSYDFMTRHGLSPFDTSNALWNLSRVLCASYYGNSSRTRLRRDADGKEHAVAAKLIDPATLVSVSGWPKGYRDLCRYCPVEHFCQRADPASVYYDWGVKVNAGAHVVYPGRESTLEGIQWYDLPVVLTRRRDNGLHPQAPFGQPEREGDIFRQLPLSAKKSRSPVR